MSRTSDLLRAARKLIESPANWCQGDFAFDSRGKYVSPLSDTAVRFCAVGAFMRASESDSILNRDGRFKAVTAALKKQKLSLDLSQVNDTLGHAAVLKVYDDAIALAESETD